MSESTKPVDISLEVEYCSRPQGDGIKCTALIQFVDESIKPPRFHTFVEDWTISGSDLAMAEARGERSTIEADQRKYHADRFAARINALASEQRAELVKRDGVLVLRPLGETVQ